MFAPDDTIVAIATAAGRGGIGVVRLSGPQAPQVAVRLLDHPVALEPRQATFARVASTGAPRATALDEVVVTWFAEPSSYTGQHVVEISAHGSPVVLDAIVRKALDHGARLARPGEFTLRAFLNGKRDLIQAEAVADLIAAVTPLQAQVAFDQLDGTLSRLIAGVDEMVFDLVVRLEASLDFPEEGYHFVGREEVVARIDLALARIDALLGHAARGRLIREGATVVIAGRPNVGKSSLFNVLAGADRAIVTDVAGTTRDLVTERIDLGGLAITLVDTAGARDAVDVVERLGVERATRARAVADLVLVVVDGSEPLTREDSRLLEETSRRSRLIVANKSDRAIAPVGGPGGEAPKELHRVSALTGDGVDRLRAAIACALGGGESLRDCASISNARHIDLLRRARASLVEAHRSAGQGTTPEEFLLTDLQDARRCFDEVVGARTSEDVLDAVFSRFCIGK